MALLCLRQCLRHGFRVGAAFGAGIAIADALFGGLATIGVGVLLNLLSSHERSLTVAGGVAMIVIGSLITRSSSPVPSVDPKVTSDSDVSLLKNTAAAFALTFANPLTILIFAALLSASDVSRSGAARNPAPLVAGIFVGSLSWWIGIAAATSSVKGYIGERTIRALNISAGLIVAAFGVIGVVSGIR
jgi:putative LysE/RhtB family amino acid efflux pump